MAATIFTFRPARSSSGRSLTRLAVGTVPRTKTVPIGGLPVAEGPHDVGAAGGLEVRGDAQRLAVGDGHRRPRQVQGHDGHVRGQRGAQHDGHLVVLPGVQVDDGALGEELRDAGLEDAEVGARVLGRLRPRVAGDPEDLAQPQLGVLGHLAEEAQRAVLQVRERGVGRAGAPEAVEGLARVRREADRGHAGQDAGVGHLRDLLRQDRAARVGVALVPAPAGQVPEVLGEAGHVGGFGEVRRAGDDERAPVALPWRRR